MKWKNVLSKDITINHEVLNQTAVNLRTAHDAGMISDARLKELKVLGKQLLNTLGNNNQLVMDGSNQLAPHVLRATHQLKKVDKHSVPKPTFVDSEVKS